MGTLPFGILTTDTLEAIGERVGAPPTTQELEEEDGYVRVGEPQS